MAVDDVDHTVHQIGDELPVASAAALARTVVGQDEFRGRCEVVDFEAGRGEDLRLIIAGSSDDCSFAGCGESEECDGDGSVHGSG